MPSAALRGRDRTVRCRCARILGGFVDRTNRVLQLVEGFMPECAWLDDRGDADLPAFDDLDQTSSGARCPKSPMYLDALLADSR